MINQKQQNTADQLLESGSLPRHIAIIMDGNGRWAKRHHLPRSAGHKQGVEAIRDVIRTGSDIGIEIMTLYAFSTENWRRPAEEISFLMKLLVDYLRKEIDELDQQRIRIRTIGDLSAFSDNVRQEIHRAVQRTSANEGMTMNIALNYGGRDEIIRAIRLLIDKYKDEPVELKTLSSDIFNSALDTVDLPDPDLLIRTSGEKRISNFLLWQIAYTELYFTDELWPDFRGIHLMEAIKDYQKRKRRFGGLE